MAIIAKKNLLIAGVVIIVAAGGGVVGYTFGKDSNKATPKTVPKVDNNVSALERATKPPQNAISPTAVAKNISDYVDKKVTVYGLVTKVSDGTYLVVGQEAKDPGGLLLDFSKANIDPTKYANTPPADTSKPPEIKEAITINGTVKRTDKGIVLVIDSVQEKNNN